MLAATKPETPPPPAEHQKQRKQKGRRQHQQLRSRSTDRRHVTSTCFAQSDDKKNNVAVAAGERYGIGTFAPRCDAPGGETFGRPVIPVATNGNIRSSCKPTP